MSTLQLRVRYIYCTSIEDKFCAHSSLISIAVYPIKKTHINGAGKWNQSQTKCVQSNIELQNMNIRESQIGIENSIKYQRNYCILLARDHTRCK